MPNAIKDDFTSRSVSRQRKWQLRHPEKAKLLKKAYKQTEKAKIKKRESLKRYHIKKKLEKIDSGEYFPRKLHFLDMNEEVYIPPPAETSSFIKSSGVSMQRKRLFIELFSSPIRHQIKKKI